MLSDEPSEAANPTDADTGVPRVDGAPALHIVPNDVRVSLRPGETVLSALERAGVAAESPCGGQGMCGRCRVRVESSEPVPLTPHRTLSPQEEQEGWRLSCLLVPTADLTVHSPANALLDARILAEGILAVAERDPAVVLSARDGQTWMSYPGVGTARLDPWREGAHPMGLAVDIGTTTLVVTLFDLKTGGELATASALNPQTRFGHDVLSRIQKGSTPSGLAELAALARNALNALTREACARAAAEPGEVLDVVLGGNTTMLQLLGEFDPSSLGRVPFEVGMETGRSYPVARFGLELHPAARVYVPPVAHAFVGSDISAGLLASGFFEEEGPVLFMDVGTNGEMALSAGGRWLVTSAAAGPAFEGMGITHGMRAATGAVESVHLVEGEVVVGVIGGGEAAGICGSGLIDGVATLLELGILAPNGRMASPGEVEGARPGAAARLRHKAGAPVFHLGGEVDLTQQDVRQLQLAKGAMRTAIDLLLDAAGLAPDAVRKVILAGGFGYHLRPASLERLGLIPRGFAERMTFAGNTSRLGAGLLLLDAKRRSYLEERMRRVEHLSLAEGATFQEAFISNLAFPVAPPASAA